MTELGIEIQAGELTPPCFVACSRCTGMIRVDDEEVKKLIRAGTTFDTFHQACGADQDPLRAFRVIVGVYEVFDDTPAATEADPEPERVERIEKLVEVAADSEGPTFLKAFDDLEKRLGEKWRRVREHGGVIDAMAAKAAAEAAESAPHSPAPFGSPTEKKLILPT